MTTFLNYDPLRGFSLNASRNTGIWCGTTEEAQEELEKGNPFCCEASLLPELVYKLKSEQGY